eukprot:gene14487-30841_t
MIKIQTVKIGVIASRFKSDNVLSIDGTQQIAAIIMALNQINNKHDGVYDDILPATQIRFALRTPVQNFLKGLKAADDMSSVVFDGQGVKGVIGAGGDETSRATGQ